MRTVLYISVILGITFLTLRFIGLFLDLTYNDLFLTLGLILLLGVALPLNLYIRKQYKDKVKDIIADFESRGYRKPDSDKRRQKSETIDYPSFRNQKQGLKWGGGNIHGSTATRGSKKGFLKR